MPADADGWQSCRVNGANRKTMTIFLAATLLAGCGRSAAENAEDDAARKAAQIGKEIHGVRNDIWTAEDLGRRAAVREDAKLLAIAGSDTGTKDGVTLTLKITGTGADQPLISSGEPEQTFEFCFDVRITRYEVGEPRKVACPANAPITYPAQQAAPLLPAEDKLKAALARVTDETSARSAIADLQLDQRVRTQYVTRDGVVGVALRADDASAHSFDCRLVRITRGQPVKLDVWRPASVYLQPGELSCTAGEAAGGLGMRPPH